VFGLSVLAVLNCSEEVMILRNAKVLRSPSESTTLVRNNAHHDSGVSYRDASVEASDVSPVGRRVPCAYHPIRPVVDASGPMMKTSN